MTRHTTRSIARGTEGGRQRPAARGRAAPLIVALALSQVVAAPAGRPAARPSAVGPAPMRAGVGTRAGAAMLPYYIEALRARRYPGGPLAIGAALHRGPGFTAYAVSWPSGGQTMTGSLEVPAGRGPFPVVVIAHGYVAPTDYAVGLDSWRYGDALAAQGFLVAAPDYPGHAGSGPGPAGFPASVAAAVATLDLIGALDRYPRADVSRVALLGHSQGGEVAMLAMVVAPRVQAVALFAPDSSDMADNARRWWAGTPGAAGAVGTPKGDPVGFAHISPRRYFRRGGPPVLLVQGTADEQIPAAWTTATYAALRRAGVRARLVWIPGARHIMGGADLAREVAAAGAWFAAAFRP